MAINYKEFEKEAKNRKVSVFLLIKDYIGFRDKDIVESGCSKCRNVLKANFMGCERLVCDIIGVSGDHESFVSAGSTCGRYYKPR
jgi:hypothetical protein